MLTQTSRRINKKTMMTVDAMRGATGDLMIMMLLWYACALHCAALWLVCQKGPRGTKEVGTNVRGGGRQAGR
jgi:hypothetical protein